MDQIRNKWRSLRYAYRVAVRNGQVIPQGPQLSFINKLFVKNADKIPPSLLEKNSTEPGDRNVGESRETNLSNNEKEKSTTENNLISHSACLKPVLSIKKIDAVLENEVPSKKQINSSQMSKVPPHKRGKRPKSRPLVQQKVVWPKATKPIVHQEPAVIENEDEQNEQRGGAKKRRYQREVPMTATQEIVPRRPTSTYASLSIGMSTDRRIVPSYNYDMHNDRPAPERANSPPPPTLKRHESYYDPRYSIFPTIPFDYNDDDMAFFRSLLTWTRRFSEDEKLEFRSEVMRLISRMRSHESADNYYVISQTPFQ